MAKKKKKTTTKKVKKFKLKNLRNFIIILVLSAMTLAAVAGLSFCVYIMVSAPDFDVNKLYKSSASTIYDADMNVIATLGAQNRQNVTYDELPDVLVDAIVATEDSKFFQHSGIDLLRFAKALLGQLAGQSGAGGGSTLTMQVVKNTYNGTESHGIKGIIRKFTDIYMAVFKVEKTYTKQEIIEFYVNQPYLGGSSYGVGQASQTYFSKKIGELNLAEAAMIAGLFQAPGAYDPFISPEKAEARRNQVLSLMVRHGYITKEEFNIAKSIPVESMLKAPNKASSEYQGFIDTVVVQVEKETGSSPYSVSMDVYTTMKKSKQDVINKLYDGTIYTWKNDVVQAGVGVTDVKTGAIVAVGAGRNKKGILTLNYATSINRQPGSTAKPIFDYGPAIEYAGWGTGTTVVDDVYKYTSGGNLNNVDYSYLGIMTIKNALAKSRNVPALQTFQATTQAQKYEFITNLGINYKLYNGEILESASIGAFNGVNPVQLSAAYGAFSRGGYYIEPYSFTKVIFNETGEIYTHPITKTKAMNEETAYLINNILTYAVASGNVSAPSVSGTNVASKTGTTSVDGNQKKALGLSSDAIMDVWQVVYSPDYSIAFWYGYDNLNKEAYLTSSEGWQMRKKIAHALGSRILEPNAKWTKPKGVVSVDIELETIPVQLASEHTPDSLRSTEYFKAGTEPTEVSTRFATLNNVSNLTYSSVGNIVKLSWNQVATPDAIDSNYLRDYFNTGYKNWADKYYDRRVNYNNANIGTIEYSIYQKGSDGTLTKIGSTPNSTFTTYVNDASTATFVVKTNYTIFKANASSGSEIRVTVTPPVQEEQPQTPEDENTITNGE